MASKVFIRNLIYFKQQLSALLVNTSSTVKFICAGTICGYLLSYSETAVQVLSVTPGFLMPPSFWIWTAFTFWFLELYFWEVLVDIITVGLCGKLIEPLWGQMEMLIFFTITNMGVAILTSLYYLFVYFCTKNTDLLFGVHIHGLAGYVAAVCVAVRQIMPDLIIAKTRIGKLTNRNIPLTVLMVSLVLWCFNLLDGTFPAMFTSGLLVSWVYLRFYQPHGIRNRGDSSESFTFASFFPLLFQPVISILVNPLHLCFLKVGVIKPLVPSRDSSIQLTSVNVTIPGSDPQNMERRRQIALKALSERLSKTTDSSRHNLLPKSIPQTKHNHAHSQHNHSHQHHHHHQQHHSHHPQFPLPSSMVAGNALAKSFVIPAIPLPPPAANQSGPNTTFSSDHIVISDKTPLINSDEQST